MRSQVAVPLVAMLVAAQACCCCTILGGPEPPYDITPSEEAVQQLEERLNSIEIGDDGSFSITITEEEMTSLVVHNLNEQMLAETPIVDPQVHFRNDRIECYAEVQFGGFLTLPGLIAFSMTAQDGGIEVAVEEIALGPLPIPSSLLQSLTDLLNETLSDLTMVEGMEATVESVEIGDGELTILGQVTASD